MVVVQPCTGIAMTMTDWDDLKAAASHDSGLDAHEWTSKLLLQLRSEAKVLSRHTVTGPFAPQHLKLAKDSLYVADGLRARATQKGVGSSSMFRQLQEVLDEVGKLFRSVDLSPAQSVLDEDQFNRAALDLMTHLGIHAERMRVYTGRYTDPAPMPLQKVFSHLRANEELLRGMLSPQDPITTGQWVHNIRHRQSLIRDWIPVLQDWTKQSAVVSTALTPQSEAEAV